MNRSGPDGGNRQTPARSSSSLLRWTALGGSLLLLLAPVAAAHAPPAQWGVGSPSWTNGVVLCQFSTASPLVSASAVSRADTGLSATVSSIEEVSATGTVVANASLSSVHWTAANFSTDDAYDLGYTSHVALTGPAYPFPVLGSADLRVDFVLPAYQGSPSGPTDTVAMVLLVSNWTWQAASDHLSLSLPISPTFAENEHLVLGSSPGPLVSGVSTSTGSTYESLAAPTTAAVGSSAPGAPTSVAASPSVTGNSSQAFVSVVFGSSAGEFSNLSYSTSIQILLPSTVAGIPTIDLVAVAGVAAVVSILVAVGARRARRRPSDLTYVDEEEA